MYIHKFSFPAKEITDVTLGNILAEIESIGEFTYAVTMLETDYRHIDYHGKRGHMSIFIFGAYWKVRRF